MTLGPGTIEEVVRNQMSPILHLITLMEEGDDIHISPDMIAKARENVNNIILASSKVSDLLLPELFDTFQDAFGRTPLTQRLEDIDGENRELQRWTDMANLREETGDLLASTLMLALENGWKPEELIYENIKKIRRRREQYKGLGRKVSVAILGGAFDPIHEGHIAAAKFVLNTSKTFDEVWLMPANKHMHGKSMTSVEHRINMCSLAAEVDGRIKVSRYEVDNDLAGETYHTMVRLMNEDFAKDQYDFSLIIGQDNANSFDTWVNYTHLERLCRFVVVSRLGEKPNGSDWYLKSPHIYLRAETEIPGVSSTMVRQGIMVGNDPVEPGYLTQTVYDYIKNHGLYSRKEKG
jgi:nicotinate-nucleotide adenylyltransferase